MIPPEVIVTLATAAGSWWMKKSAQDAANIARERELHIKGQQASSIMADAASKRGSPWLRKFAAICILSVAFGGILIVAFFPDIPVSILHEVPQKSFLGLFKWGSTVEVIQANGFVLPEWVRFSVCAVIGFLFGPGFAKAR